MASWRDTIQPVAAGGWRETIQPREAEEEVPSFIRKSEIEGIAKKHGVNVSELTQLAPYFGADVEGVEPGKFEKTVGFLGEAVALGLPQKYTIAKQEKPEERAALEELRSLAEERKSGIRAAAEIGAGLATGVGVARGLARGAVAAPRIARAIEAAVPAASGAVTGAAHAPVGEEVKGAAVGGAVGFVLGKAAEKLMGSVVAGTERVRKVLAERLLPEVGDMLAKDSSAIARGAADILERNRASDEVIERAILTRGVSKKVEEVALVLPRDARQVILAGIPEERLAKYRDPTKKLGGLVRAARETEARRAGKPVGTADDFIALTEFQSQAREFARFLKPSLDPRKVPTTTGAKKIIEEFRTQHEGEDFLKKSWQEFRQKKANLEYIQKNAIRTAPGAGSWMRWLGLKLADGKFALRSIDIRNGTDTELVGDSLAEAHNKFTVAMGPAFKKYGELNRAGGDWAEIGKALDGRKTAVADDVLAPWKETFDDALEIAKEVGVPIRRRENYLPMKMAGPEKVIPAMEKRAASFGLQPLRTIDSKMMAKLQASEDGNGFLLGLKKISGNGKVMEDPVAATAAWREMAADDVVRERIATTASASWAREGEEIPDFIREWDPRALYIGWMHNTLRHAYLREGLQELRSRASQLRAMGDDMGAGHIEDLMQDIAGIRRGTLASAATSAATKWATSINRMVDQVGGSDTRAGKTLETVAGLPALGQTLLNQVYPNYLGLSPKAIIRNLTQPMFMTAPEIGAAGYGQKMILLATKDALEDKARGINWRQVLQRRGLSPEQFTGEGREHLARGLAASAPAEMAGEALQRWTALAMNWYEKSDIANRYITLKAAGRLSDDLTNGIAGARQYLVNRSPVYRGAMEAALERGDREELQHLIARDLNAGTQFNYNRVSMSAFGRYMGPALSMFTKWPTSVGGDIATRFQQHGILEGGRQVGLKYFAPWGLLYMVDKAREGEEVSPREAALVGRRGFREAAPFQGLLQYAEAVARIRPLDVAPPLVKQAAAVSEAVTSKQDDAFWKWFNKSFQAFTPGSGLLRFLGEDVPAIVRGEREGGPFLERTTEGIKKLGK